MSVQATRTPRLAEELRLAGCDLAQGLARWRVWLGLAWQNVRAQYRRSLLGPFWITLGSTVQIATLGILAAILFGVGVRALLAPLCLGYLLWSLIARMAGEGCSSFLDAAHYLRQVQQPLSVYPLWTVARNVIVFLHHLPVFLLLLVWPGVPLNPRTLLAFLTLPVAVLSVAWLAFVLGPLSARYRDVPQIVASLLGVVFYLTPVFWETRQLGSRAYLADLNPLSHVIEIVRLPLLGRSPAPASLAVTGALVFAGWAAALFSLARCRTRLAYWL